MKTKIILSLLCLILMSTNALRLTNHHNQYAWYTYDEGPSGNTCENDDECDG